VIIIVVVIIVIVGVLSLIPLSLPLCILFLLGVLLLLLPLGRQVVHRSSLCILLQQHCRVLENKSGCKNSTLEVRR
jgi:membrane protein implicated in regulation of membrane protease activity